MSGALEERKSRLKTLAAAAMVMCPALVFAVLADAPHVPVICALGIIPALLLEKPVRHSDRSVIYSCVIALTAAVLADMIIPVNDDRFGMLGGIFQTGVSAQFLLYAAVTALYQRTSAYSMGVAAALSMAAFILSGDKSIIQFYNTRLPITNQLFWNFGRFYTAAAFSETALLLILLNLSMKGGGAKIPAAARPPGAWKKHLVRAALLAALPCAGLGALWLYNEWQHKIREFEVFLIRLGSRGRAGGGMQGAVFSKETDLNRTISPEFMGNMRKIVLRASADSPPGYLRGRAYSVYGGGRWAQRPGDNEKLGREVAGGMLAFGTFQTGARGAPGKPCFVIPSKNFYSDALLFRGDTVKIEIVADKLNRNPEGTVFPEDWERGAGYVVFSPSGGPECSAWSFPPASELSPELTAVPEGLAARLDTIIKKEGLKTEGDDSAAAGNIIRFLRRDFTYSLEPGVPPEGEDPVLFFLEKSRKGHCELFASAAALLLRRCGIPSRYSAGFICAEKHPAARCYAARVGDAHAWTEMFDRQKGSWEALEPTPESGLAKAPADWGSFEALTDGIGFSLRKFIAGLRMGYFADAVMSVIMSLWDAAVWILFSVYGAAAALLAAAALCVYAVRRRAGQRGGARTDRNLGEIVKAFRRAEKLVSGKTGVRRAQSMTIGEWLDRAGAAEPFRRLAAEYQRLRFRSNPPTDTERRDFEAAVRRFIREKKWAPK